MQLQQFVVHTQPRPYKRTAIRVGEYLGTYWATTPADALRKAGRVAGYLTRRESLVVAVALSELLLRESQEKISRAACTSRNAA